jgi:hypothetical protein|tara:strand:- start:1112 stop:1333 length:222 start_codon:yes stop_codon:yes gene_type:complete
LRHDTSNGQASFLSFADNTKQESLVSQQATILSMLPLKGKTVLNGSFVRQEKEPKMLTSHSHPSRFCKISIAF